MRNVSHKLAAAAIISLAGTIPASAATITITQTLDASNAKNTDIRSGKPTQNYSGLGTFYSYEHESSFARGLLQFDLPTIPINAVISSAKLSVTQMNYGNASNVDVSVYQMLVSWMEDEATWNKRDNSTNWSTAGMQPGTDRAIDALDTVNTGDNPGVNTWDITSLYKQWQAGTADNYGLSLLTDSVLANDVQPRFFATSANNMQLNPYLTITYDVVPEPSSAIILLSFGGGLLLKRLRKLHP